MIPRLRSPLVVLLALLSGVFGGVGYFLLASPTPRHAVELASADKLRNFPALGPRPDMRLQLLGFSEDGDSVLIGRALADRQGHLQVWSSRSGRLIMSAGIGEFPGPYWKVSLSPRGKYLAAMTFSPTSLQPHDLALWSTADGAELWRLSLYDTLIKLRDDRQQPIGNFESLRFHPNEQSLWVTSRLRSVQLSLVDHAILQVIEHDGSAIAFSADGRRAAFCQSGWTLYDLENARILGHRLFDATQTVEDGILSFADQDQVAILSVRQPRDEDVGFPIAINREAEGLRLMETATWREFARFPQEVLIAVSQDGQRLVSRDRENKLRLRDVVSGSEFPLPPSQAADVWPHSQGGFYFPEYRSSWQPWKSESVLKIHDLMTGETFGGIPCDWSKCQLNRPTDTLAAIRGNTLEIYDWPLPRSPWPSLRFGGMCAVAGGLVSIAVNWARDRRQTVKAGTSEEDKSR